MPSKVVYLLGAGATHAEIVNLYPKKSNDALFLKKNGLLMKEISERVIEAGKKTGLFNPSWIKRQLSPAGLSNIELFIGLISMNQVKSEKIISGLKELRKRDIEGLVEPSVKRFYLHKSLLEFHSLVNQKEKLLGIISLNYDNVIDRAFKDLSLVSDYGYSTNRDR